MYKKLASRLFSGIMEAAEDKVNLDMDLVKGAIGAVSKLVKNNDDDDDDDEEEEKEDLDVERYSKTMDMVYQEDKGFALRRKDDKVIFTDWYDEIQYLNEACGMIYRSASDSYFLLNHKTGQVIEKQFVEYEPFGENLVKVLNEKSHYALYNADGHKVFGWMNDIGNLKRNGYALVENKKEEYAVIDRNGELVSDWSDRKTARIIRDSK